MAIKEFGFSSLILVVGICLDSAEGWSGHLRDVLVAHSYLERYCASHFLWWCTNHRYRWRTNYSYEPRCQYGWTHNGNENCVIPVCNPHCANGGSCINPDTCRCPSTAEGHFCQRLTCSYQNPCYPGECYNTNQCRCISGFRNQYSGDGCLKFDASVEGMHPVVGRSTAKLAHIRRTDKRVLFMYELDGTNTTYTQTIWSNQKRFNTLQFQFESLFTPPDNIPLRPTYVHRSDFGIVHSQITVNVSKVSRSGSLIRDPGSVKVYPCNNGATDTSPRTGVLNCSIHDDQFKTLIEHGDWMNVKFETRNGGFRELRDIDHLNQLYRTDHYRGITDIKSVEFQFDFIAPKFCLEPGAFASCPLNPNMLDVEEEFTKDAIKPRWSGWTDDLSGMWEYLIEIFLLTPDPYGRLVEGSPLSPVYTQTVSHQSNIQYPTYTPNKAGIYSVLMTVRDEANNSRIARRFAIYDPVSNISLNSGNNTQLFVSSANAESGYQWQTTVSDDNYTTFVVNWSNHFVNELHENGKYLNEILPYPVQFKDLQDDGILSSKKFVEPALDDHEGQLTRNGITNFNGVVKFEIARVYTLDTNEPHTGWDEVNPLAESYSFRDKLSDGRGVRIWVRAFDVMGNTRVDFTSVRVDRTKPEVTSENSNFTSIQINYNGGTYNYTTRIKFKALDPHSGVNKISYAIKVNASGRSNQLIYDGSVPANMKLDDGFCTSLDGTCYTPEQTLDLDNCWFMVSKKDLDTSSATVTVTAYNSAMLSRSITFKIPHINELHGLEKYSGPENFRIEKATAEGFRISWDLPKDISCYGQTEIVLVIFYIDNGQNKSETYVVSGSSTFFDILGRTPNTDYRVSLGMRAAGGALFTGGTNLAVRTSDPEGERSGGVPAGVVAGVAVGVIVLIAVIIMVFIILMRRGHFQPVRRGISRARTVVAKRARRTFYGGVSAEYANSACNKRTSDADELYIYGGMDFREPQKWHIPRSDITFESVIKEGHFVIYKALLRSRKYKTKAVVAKTLKEGFTETDEMLMKAKINFTATAVGDHPNIIKFLGAVVDNIEMGPMIIYEYCDQGPLKDYLQAHKSNVTVELHEQLFRFGLGIAKGMEYLASKKIVHRRLAARNILLTFLKEIKIAGFGPQPANVTEDDGDAENGKRERIPIKWMGPECMSSTKDATEKSDVWSYAVVLWEIFSLGATPYENIRSRDLPGHLKEGERLPKTELCDDTWYGVMKQCWAYEQNKRPTFSKIRNQLDNLFVAAPGDDYYYYKR